MEIEEKLDLIWNECKWNLSNEHNEEHWKDIAKKVCGNTDYQNNPLFRTYLIHLIDKDKLVYVNSITGRYTATISGLLFEGYVKRKKNESIRNEENEARLKRMEKSEEQLSLWTKRLTRGTYLVAIGAIALVIWEIYKTFFIELHYH